MRGASLVAVGVVKSRRLKEMDLGMLRIVNLGFGGWCGVLAERDSAAAASGCREQQRRRQTAGQTAAKCPPIVQRQGHSQRRAFEVVGQEPAWDADVRRTGRRPTRRGARLVGTERRNADARRATRRNRRHDSAGLEAPASAVAHRHGRRCRRRRPAVRRQVGTEQRRQRRRRINRRPPRAGATAADVARVRDGRGEARSSMLCHRLAAFNVRLLHYAVLVRSASSVIFVVHRPIWYSRFAFSSFIPVQYTLRHLLILRPRRSRRKAYIPRDRFPRSILVTYSRGCPQQVVRVRRLPHPVCHALTWLVGRRSATV